MPLYPRARNILASYVLSCLLPVVLAGCIGDDPLSSGDSPNVGDGSTESSADGGSSVDPPDGSSGSTDSSSGQSPNGALKILSAAATLKTLTLNPLATESITTEVSAIVTNTQGLESIAGGRIQDELGNTYASFGTGATKGTFVAQLSWDGINKIRSLDYDTAGGVRNFTVTFFDNAANEASASLVINFRCNTKNYWNLSASGFIQKGACVDVRSENANCGKLGTVCADNMTCCDGRCAKLSPAARDSRSTCA